VAVAKWTATASAIVQRVTGSARAADTGAAAAERAAARRASAVNVTDRVNSVTAADADPILVRVAAARTAWAIHAASARPVRAAGAVVADALRLLLLSIST
jgi:hypothetical protein